MRSKSDFDPYEGYQAVGWPTMTIAGGRVIVRDGQIVGEPGAGRLLQRDRYKGLDGRA